MIAFLSGTVYRKNTASILLETHGVGYRVLCTVSTLATVKEKKEAFLYTYHHIREDSEELFGFVKEAELHFFEKLISVSGIGPKTALDILEVPLHLLSEAIEKGDVAYLKSLKGIGKKTAERMILELRGNLSVSTDTSGIPPEVLQALTDLGFDRTQVQKAFHDVPDTLQSAEDMVKWFLQKSA